METTQHIFGIDLLRRLIATPSLCREEDKTAGIIEDFLKGQGCNVFRIGFIFLT